MFKCHHLIKKFQHVIITASCFVVALETTSNEQDVRIKAAEENTQGTTHASY